MAKCISMNKDWEAENDANTLAEAEAIKSDKKRMSAASRAAKRIESDAKVRAKAMSKIANKKMAPTKKQSAPKRSNRPVSRKRK